MHESVQITSYRQRHHELLVVVCILFAAFGCSDRPHRTIQSSSGVSEPTTIRIAAASDLKFALNEVVEQFRSEHSSIHIESTFGSSGNLYAQLSNKAPFDLFLSADIEFPRKLIEQGVAFGDSEFPYAMGLLVVWVPKTSSIDIENAGIECLKSPTVKTIAIANPNHAPYGRAAVAALRHFELYESLEEKLVFGENVSQAAQFVESGAADVGIIAQSLALAPSFHDQGRFWKVPVEAHPELKQGGVILTETKHRKECDQFKTFLTGETGRTILRRYGFVLPGE